MLICSLVSIKAAGDSRLRREKAPSKILISLDSKVNGSYATFPCSYSAFMFVFLKLSVSVIEKLRHRESLNNVMYKRNQNINYRNKNLIILYESIIT